MSWKALIPWSLTRPRTVFTRKRRYWHWSSEAGRAPDGALHRILSLAHREAASQRTVIQPGHLLLGLFLPPVSAAGQTLMTLGVQPKSGGLMGLPVAVAADNDTWPPPPRQVEPETALLRPQEIFLSADALRVIELATREAARCGATWITPAHLVIGLLEFRRGSPALLLRMHNITVDSARRALYG